MENNTVNYEKVINNYIDEADWRVKENSSVNYSLGGLILGNSGAMTANYWLNKVFDEDGAQAHKNGDIHIHDLSMLSPYCAGWSLKQLIEEGLGGVTGKIASAPAKHFSTLCNQMVNFLGVLQNEWAGAQAFSSVDTLCAPFIKKDGLTYDQVKQCIQNLVFGLNVSSRWGCVDTDTEVLSVDGFKKYNELKEGDLIYTWKNGELELNPVIKVVVKEYDGEMHEYTGDNYSQLVTADHRVLFYKNGYFNIEHSNNIEDVKGIFLPVKYKNAKAFGEYIVNENNKEEINKIQKELLSKGVCSYTKRYKNGHVLIVPFVNELVQIKERKTSYYKGLVWCPSVENGTAVFRRHGQLFISGQCQCPFTNFTLDWTVPADLAVMPAIVGGKEQDFTYADCKEEMDMFNKAFLEVMIEGDADGREFAYPIPTYSITKDFDWSETENNKLLFEMAAKYGTPYFSNYINSNLDPSSIRSMCCRLRLELSELRRKNGGYFGSGDKTGSVTVVTLNMPRLAYKANNIIEFYNNLDRLMDIAAKIIEQRRAFCTKMMEDGLYPYTKRYLGNFDNHFSTIGLVGMNEACLNAKWIKNNLTDKKAQAFTKAVLNHMRDRLVIYQEEYGHLFNLEATPAESTAYRFAKKDKELYPDIITASDETPYYTNSSHLPVGATDDIFDALDIQDELQTLYTSGTVFHAFLGEKLPDWKAAMELVKAIAHNYKLPYFTLSPTFSICKNHGYIQGEEYTCPQCHEKTEVYSRITGYYRPVQNWNNGKTQEFKDRKEYKIKITGDDSLGIQTDTEDDCHCNVTENTNNLNVTDIENSPEDVFQNAHQEPEVVFDQIKSKTELTPGLYLVTTETCPKCKIAKKRLEENNIQYTALNAEENEDLVKELNIKTAPTMIEILKDKTIHITNSLSDIFEYVLTHSS